MCACVCCQALKALGVCCFVCGEPGRLNDFLSLCEVYFCMYRESHCMRRQALESWALCAAGLVQQNRAIVDSLIYRCACNSAAVVRWCPGCTTGN